MAELQIETITRQNTLQLLIKYPSSAEITYNFALTVAIYEQNMQQRTDYLVYKNTFHVQKSQILIKDLKFTTMYKVVVANKYGGAANSHEITKNIFVYTQSNRNYQDIENNENKSNFENWRQQARNMSANQGRRNTINKRSQSKKTGKSNFKGQISHKPKHNMNDQLCNSELLIKTIAQSNRIGDKNQVHKYLLESRKCKNLDEFINQRNGNRINKKQVIDKRMLVIQSKLLFAEIYKHKDGHKFFDNDWFMGPFYSYDQNEKDIRKH